VGHRRRKSPGSALYSAKTTIFWPMAHPTHSVASPLHHRIKWVEKYSLHSFLFIISYFKNKLDDNK
jgi:hypothetical protein